MPTVKCTWSKILEPGIRSYIKSRGNFDMRMYEDFDADRLVIMLKDMTNENMISTHITRYMIEDDQYSMVFKHINMALKQLEKSRIVIPIEELRANVDPTD